MVPVGWGVPTQMNNRKRAKVFGAIYRCSHGGADLQVCAGPPGPALASAARRPNYTCFALTFARAGASAEPAGLRAGGWLSSRLTDRVNCPTSPALFTITTSAPVA